MNTPPGATTKLAHEPEARRMVIGRKCGHMSVTSGPYVDLADMPPSCGFGCTMRPEYAAAR